MRHRETETETERQRHRETETERGGPPVPQWAVNLPPVGSDLPRKEDAIGTSGS